uniref:PBC domain-containing protein n=1 Tax=Monopterus albus TaxID=43700 RepID=A0A3Q3IJY7_MONAL
EGEQVRPMWRKGEMRRIMENICLSGFLLHKRKHALNWHRMKSAIFSILCEVKEKTVCSSERALQLMMPGEDALYVGRVSVSVCLSLCAGPVIDQWPVYGVTQRLILSLIPGLLTSPCMQACSELTGHVKNLLREQSRMRPISPKQTEQMVTIIHRKFSAVQLQLKQSTCEAVMILRSRFLDYLLSSVFNCCNRFFFISTFMLLYAVNQVEFLVISFLLSSLKVANWFGNKRIRYKKNIGKFQEDCVITGCPPATPSSGGYPALCYTPDGGVMKDHLTVSM